jgi:hypothetical protein
MGHPDVVVAKGRMDAYYDKIDTYGKVVSKEKAKEGQAKVPIPLIDQVFEESGTFSKQQLHG